MYFPFWCLSSCATSGREGESSIYLPVVSCLRSGRTGDVDPRPQRVHHPSANEVSFLRFAMKSHGRTNRRITSQTCHSRPSRRSNSQHVVNNALKAPAFAVSASLQSAAFILFYCFGIGKILTKVPQQNNQGRVAGTRGDKWGCMGWGDSTSPGSDREVPLNRKLILFSFSDCSVFSQ